MSVSKKAKKEVITLAGVIDIGHDKELDLILYDGEMEEYVWDLKKMHWVSLSASVPRNKSK